MSAAFEGERICYIEPFDPESSTIEYREEIVRCRDCKRFDAKADGCWWFSHFEQMGDYSWDEMPAEVEPDGFCAWGERK